MPPQSSRQRVFGRHQLLPVFAALIIAIPTWSGCDSQESDITISLAGSGTEHPGNRPIDRVHVQLRLLEPGSEPLATTYTDAAGQYELVANVPREACSAGYNQAFLQLRAERTDVSSPPEVLRPECIAARQVMNFIVGTPTTEVMMLEDRSDEHDRA